MSHRLAYIVSALLHPLWMPLYAVLLLFQNGFIGLIMPNMQKILLVASVVFFTIILPLGITLFLIWRGRVSGLFMPDKRERILPYIIGIMSYIALDIFLFNHAFMLFISRAAIGMTAALVIICCVNFWWKISAHMCGTGGLCGAIFGFLWILPAHNPWLMSALMLASGLVAWARIERKAHTPAQLVAGYTVGFGCVFLSITFFSLLYQIFGI